MDEVKSEFNFEDELLKLYKADYFHFIGRDVCKTMIRDFDPDDIANELYIRCLDKKDLYKHDNIKGLRGWIFRVGWNIAYNQRRYELSRCNVLKVWRKTQSSIVFDNGEVGYTNVLIDQIMNQLPIGFKNVSMGRALGYKHREIAKIIEKPIGTVMWRQGEAKKYIDLFFSD